MKFRKLSKNKKGVNDVSIAFAIFVVFLILGFFLPFIQADFGQEVQANDISSLAEDLGQSKTSFLITSRDVLVSMFSVFFWTFGAVPSWIDLTILMALRFALYFILIRFLTLGGGS